MTSPSLYPQTAATGEIFAAVERLNERQWDALADADDEEAGPSGRVIDRGEMRQLIQRAQNEVRRALSAGSSLPLSCPLSVTHERAQSSDTRLSTPGH